MFYRIKLTASLAILSAVFSGCSTQPQHRPIDAQIQTPVVAEPASKTVTKTSNIDQQPVSRAEAICQEALLRGVDFRATGNEPSWLLEVSDDDSVLLVLNYGADRYRFDRPTLANDRVTTASTNTKHYQLQQDDHRLSVILEQKSCQDLMSGGFYPIQVTLEFDGKALFGCGKNLQKTSASATP